MGERRKKGILGGNDVVMEEKGDRGRNGGGEGLERKGIKCEFGGRVCFFL